MSSAPFISIITPTVQRDSLVDTCESVDCQTFRSYEHIVIDDSAADRGVLAKLSREQRMFAMCLKPHRNGGNTCRHVAWLKARGTWVYHLDDDNALYSRTTLEEIANCIRDMEEKWALFPIFRLAERFFFDPPKPCYFDTGNAVVRREIARWPNIDGYASDAVWLEGLMKYTYRSFPKSKPIMIMDEISQGRGGGINGQ